MFSQRHFAMRLLPALTIMVLFGGLCSGCGSESVRTARRDIAISDVPENVMAVAKKELPDVEFADGWKNVDTEGKLKSYEIRGRNKKGKIREIRISPTGEILEME